MSSWSIASMKKSVMFDVLNVIDLANKGIAHQYLENEYSLLKKETFHRYNYLYDLAKKYDDSIAAAMYVPKTDNGNSWTVLYSVFTEENVNFASSSDFITFVNHFDKEIVAECIMKWCLKTEQQSITEDMIPYMLKSKELSPISFLNETKLPEKIKFSLATLIYNHESFFDSFIVYIEKVYEAIQQLYDTYRDFFRNTYRLVRNYLARNDIEKLLPIATQIKLNDKINEAKYTIVLSLCRLEYCANNYKKHKGLFNIGLFYIQRIMHDTNFKIF